MGIIGVVGETHRLVLPANRRYAIVEADVRRTAAKSTDLE
jgi:hypothetical protein